MKWFRGSLYLLSGFGVRICLLIARAITQRGHGLRGIVDDALRELKRHDESLAIGKICQGPWQEWPEGRWLTIRVENTPNPSQSLE